MSQYYRSSSKHDRSGTEGSPHQRVAVPLVLCHETLFRLCRQNSPDGAVAKQGYTVTFRLANRSAKLSWMGNLA